MDINQASTEANAEFDKAVHHLKEEFSRLQLGRANASLIEDLNVEAYGSGQPLKGVASISIPEPRAFMIQPWDKSMLGAIEKAITNSGLGLNPINDGGSIRINIPMLTEERRAELAKRVHKLAEDAKISIRNARQSAHNIFKKLKADSDITEDDLHSADSDLQKKVDEVNKNIDELAKSKESDVMTI